MRLLLWTPFLLSLGTALPSSLTGDHTNVATPSPANNPPEAIADIPVTFDEVFEAFLASQPAEEAGRYWEIESTLRRAFPIFMRLLTEGDHEGLLRFETAMNGGEEAVLEYLQEQEG